MKLLVRFRHTWEAILIGDTTPAAIASGVALGTFVALLPSFGFSAILGLFLATLIPHINRPAVFLALALWNPIVQIPIYTLSYDLGGMLYGTEPIIRYDFALLNQVYTFTRRFLVAHLIITSAITVFSYVVAYVVCRSVITVPNDPHA